MDTLRIVTQTARGSLEIAKELKNIAIEEGIDVVVMHSPPIDYNNVLGYSSPIFTVTGVEDGEKVTPQTAIVIFNDGLRMTTIPEMSDDTCICLQLITVIGEIYLISMYCPLKVDIVRCLDKLKQLLQFIGDKQVVICIEANAKSVWWSNSDSTDDRGEILEDFILANCLCVLNRKDPLGQYRGCDYTDVTLASSNIMQKFVAWEAMEDCTAAETRTIGMEIELNYFNHLDSSSDNDMEEDYDETSDVSEHPLRRDFNVNEVKEEDYDASDSNSSDTVDDEDKKSTANKKESHKRPKSLSYRNKSVAHGRRLIFNR